MANGMVLQCAASDCPLGVAVAITHEQIEELKADRDELRDGLKEVRADLKGLMKYAIGLLVTSLLGLIGIVVQLLRK